MFRQFKLATVIAVALSIVGAMGSVEAHVGGRGGGIRLGGGLAPRGRLPGNGNGIRNGGNGGVATAPAPKPVAPPIVQIGGTKSSTKPPVASTTNKPSTGTVISSNSTPKSTAPASANEKVQAPSATAPTPATVPATVPREADVATVETPPKKPANTNSAFASHLVFNLTGSSAPEVDASATDAPATQPKALSLEAKQALEEALEADGPAAEIAPAEIVSKEVPLPQIPVGATVTLNGKDLSDKEGQVVLQIGEIALPATITEWKHNKVTFTLPVLGLTKSSKATLHVLKADGKAASTMSCELITTLPPR